MRSLAVYICLTSLVGYIVAEIDPIVVKGTHLFYKTNGTAFFIRGIVYTPFDIDPADTYTSTPDILAHGAACRRDIPYLSSLGANVVIVTKIHPDLDHSECMEAFAGAGIYVLVELVDDPKAPYYDQDALKLRASMIDSIAEFPNLLGLRIIVDENSPPTLMPFYRATTRDMRAHMAEKRYRNIPVFFTLLSEPDGFPDINDRASNDNIDYFWCHNDSPDVLAFRTQHPDAPTACWTRKEVRSAVSFFEDYGIPMVYDKIYCQWDITEDDNRTFDFITDVYVPEAKEILSGCIVAHYYELPEDEMTTSILYLYIANQRSKVTSLEDFAVDPLPGYSALSSKFAKATPTFANEKDHNPTIVPRSCPSNTPWDFPDVLPQRPYEPLCSCMLAEVKCRAKPDVLRNTSIEYFKSTIAKLCNQMPADDCVGIEANSSLGVYGGFSSCNRTTIYSWVSDRYYNRFGECDHNGTVEIANYTSNRSDNCSFLLDQVGKHGEKELSHFLESESSDIGTEHPKPNSPNRTNSEPSKISAGTWVGIGIIILVLVIVLSLTLDLLLRRRKRRKAALEEAITKDLPELVQTLNNSRLEQQREESHRMLQAQMDDLPELRSVERPLM